MNLKKRAWMFMGVTAILAATITPAVAASCTPSKQTDEKEQAAVKAQLERISAIQTRANNFLNDKLQAEEFKDFKNQLNGILELATTSKELKTSDELKEAADTLQTRYTEFKEKFAKSPSLDELRKSTSKYVDEIAKMYKDFNDGRDKLFGESGGILTDETKAALLKYEKEELAKFEAYKAKQISTSEKVWIGSVITKIQQDIAIVESDIRYVGGDASSLASDSMLQFYFNSIHWQLSEADDAYITQLIANLKAGAEKGITNSKVAVKRGVATLLYKNFKKQLKNFYNSDKQTATLTEFLDDQTLMGQLTEHQELLKKFMKFYGVEYLKSAHGEEIPAITLSKTNFSQDDKDSKFEKEDTYVLEGTLDKKVFGLGYTNADLNAKNVGIGGMKNKEAAKKIYEALLYSNLTVKKTAQEVYDWGVERSKGDLEAFEFVANKIATLITGDEKTDWTPTVKYNEVKLNATKQTKAESKDVTLKIRVDGKINMDEWYKWITQDEFYYGLEATLTKEKADEIIKDPAYAEYAKLADENGFEKYKTSDENYTYNESITNKQMYASGLEALKQYNIWREKTQDYASSFFNEGIENVRILPVEEPSDDLGSYSTRAGAFFFNLKPYMGLPKWSTTSFVNHESKMGHHNQLWYTKSYAAKEGDKQFEIFDSTAYAEGWALFMEWFAIETGWYGTPDYSNPNNYDKIPTDFYHAQDGYLPALADDTKATEAEITYLKEVAGGTYWNMAKSVQTKLSDTEIAKIAIQVGNLMQYYGAINEATMRDNRLALDTAVHGVIDKPDSYIGSGISINEEREFMKKHLQLPSDINAYPKRYLGYPAQATSYNTGKEVMKDIYKKVQKASGKSRKEFAEDKVTLRKMFNLYLSYGNIPLDVLEELVYSQMLPNTDDANKY